MLGSETYKPFAINTFSKRGRSFEDYHYVRPHAVSSYIRKDGTFVKGYWRDGDGNTAVDRGIGYFVRNAGSGFKK